MPPRSIKKILAFHFAYITIIPFTLLFALTLMLVLPREKAEVNERNQQLAVIIDERIESFLNEQVFEINKVFFIELNEQNVQRLLDRIVEDSESLNALYLVTTAGIIKKCGFSFEHEDALHEDLEGVDMSNSSAFKKVSSQRKAVWSDVFVSVVTGRQSIAYAIPLNGSYLIGEVSLKHLSAYLQRISPGDGSLIFIADRNGQVIAAQDNKYSTRQMNISNLELMRRESAPEQIVTGPLTVDNKSYLGAVTTINLIGWRSLLATPSETALKGAYSSTKIILVGLLLSLCLAAASAKVLLKKLSRQFDMLTGFTRQIAMHSDNLVWQSGGVVEFDHFVATLQQMTDILREREGAIMEGLDHIRLDKVRFECLFELSKKVELPEQDILDYALEAAVKVTDSKIGYIYSLNGDETVLTLHAWSKNVMAECGVQSPPANYPVAETGLWGEAVRQRRPVITNDYAAENPLKHGCPEGHVEIRRHLNLPVFSQGKIVLLVGVGNKDNRYDDEDIHQLTLLLDAALLLIEKKRSEKLLKESEERSMQMFQQNEDALVFFKLSSMRPIDANPAAYRMFGVAKHALNRLSPRWIFRRADLVRLFAFIKRGEIDLLLEKVKCRLPDGTSFDAGIKGTIISLNDERILFCSIRDMTAKVKIVEEMKATQAKLIQANKMTSLGLLVSSIAHEINNPNQCIGMNAFIMGRVWREAAPMLLEFHRGDESFLLDGVPFAEMKQTVPFMIDTIADSSKKIDSYILQLMNFVKAGKGGLAGDADLNKAVENAVSILWYHIRSSTERFKTQLSAKKPLVKGDFHQIEQIVINMITNALQSLPSKSAAVTVETDISEDGADAIIRFRDEGKGMDNATIARLAEPFFSTRHAEGGTGLGVYISSNIIKEHQGTIEYDSMLDRGTTVTIRLPLLTKI